MKKFFLLSVLIILTNISYSQTQLWGMTPKGGAYNEGTIFKMDLQGSNQTVQHSFEIQNDGKNPAYSKILEASDGKFYGMTSRGGVNNFGVIYQYDPITSLYQKKFDFAGSTSGALPMGSLIQANDGMLYGMTSKGGINDMGVLFRYNPLTSVFTKLLDFAGTTNGKNPQGGLIQASNGKLYGMTLGGGVNDLGIIFQYDPLTSVFTKKLDFAGYTNGSAPYSTLIQATDGMLYGTASAGGIYSGGVIFKFDPTNSNFTKLHEFNGSIVTPYASLIQASDGKLYGTTYNGRSIFSYDLTNSAYANRYSFSFGLTFGLHGSLVQASDGNLYGLTGTGGYNPERGFIYQFNPVTSLATIKFNFGLSPTVASTGIAPMGSLISASDGKLYGVTCNGGSSDVGVFFQYDPINSTYSKKFDFYSSLNGKNPRASLLQASNGKLYGLTYGGGIDSTGVIFQYDLSTSTFSKKHNFGHPTYGANPVGSLIEASDGKIYGMGNGQGSLGYLNLGTVFQYNPATNVYTKKTDLTLGSSGSLMQASDGKLYGTTNLGGDPSDGVLFQYNSSTAVDVDKVVFDEYSLTNPVKTPIGSLIQATDGMLYSLSFSPVGFPNSSYWNSVLIKYNPTTGICNSLRIDSVYQGGFYPNGSLVQAMDGKLYGLMSQGGLDSLGVLFQYDLTTSTYTVKVNFNGVLKGSTPTGTLMQASNGMLYGATQKGGVYDMGVVFQYDPSADVFTKLVDFNGANGAYPEFFSFIEVNSSVNISTGSISSAFCAGSNISVPFNISGGGAFSGNIFIAQLSDSLGSFTSPLDIGSLNSFVSGSILATIPDSITYGTGYRIRVISSTPTIIGPDNGQNITIYPKPSINANASTTTICSGASVVLYGSGTPSTFLWTGGIIDSVAYVPSNSGIYTLVGTNSYGCTDTSFISITVNTIPTITPQSDVLACKGDVITTNISVLPINASYSWSNNNLSIGLQSSGSTPIPTFSASSSSINPETAEIICTTEFMGCIGTPDTFLITVFSGCTYPGDANYDGVANNNDLLELGLRYGAIGTARSTFSNNWQGYLSTDWGTDTVSTGYNLKHADCNGDGTINFDDTLAINLNYGLTHTLRLADINKANATGDIYFGSAQLGYGAGQQVAIDVYLGESTNPLQNFYGAAFTIDYNDNMLIQPGSMSFSIDDASWVGTINTDAIRLTKPMEGIEIIDAAICKTNHVNTSGAGKIGTLRFIASNTIGNFSVTASNAYYIDNAAIQTPLTSATYTVNINTAVGLQNQTSNSNISIYPNPNNGTFTLSNLNTREEYKLEVEDLLGRTVYTDVIKSNTPNANIKLNQAAGVYWLQITSKQGGAEVFKVVVE